MPTMTTNVQTRQTTIAWNDTDIAVLQWTLETRFKDSDTVKTLPDAAHAILATHFQNVWDQFLADVAARRTKAYMAAPPEKRAQSDAVIGFDPWSRPDDDDTTTDR